MIEVRLYLMTLIEAQGVMIYNVCACLCVWTGNSSRTDRRIFIKLVVEKVY